MSAKEALVKDFIAGTNGNFAAIRLCPELRCNDCRSGFFAVTFPVVRPTVATFVLLLVQTGFLVVPFNRNVTVCFGDSVAAVLLILIAAASVSFPESPAACASIRLPMIPGMKNAKSNR